MINLYLLKYRIRHNDVGIKNKIKLIIFLLLLIIFVPTFVIINPFLKLRDIVKNKEYKILPYNIIKAASFSNNSNDDNIILPISGTITSYYGYRNDPISGTYSKHTGIDISGIHHDNVRSIEDGSVTFAGHQNGYGYCIEIKHENYYSFYAHLSKISVTVNSNVSKGSIIGLEGGDPYTDPNPGYSTGHHLHFEIRTNSGYGNDINPINYISKTM